MIGELGEGVKDEVGLRMGPPRGLEGLPGDKGDDVRKGLVLLEEQAEILEDGQDARHHGGG
ncbi:MAG TPA: hypothetical protein VHQ90_08810 [Thermoanaerobaculia bacterium]|nr:hypothetical protein [Thermoanaerobaculia bacterium]